MRELLRDIPTSACLSEKDDVMDLTILMTGTSFPVHFFFVFANRSVFAKSSGRIRCDHSFDLLEEGYLYSIFVFQGRQYLNFSPGRKFYGNSEVAHANIGI